jgi:glycosyltransferase involved in cell wall biosynthesis
MKEGNMATISACVIASDRHFTEDYLGETLRSIRDSVDEIVVVRTGNGPVGFRPDVDVMGYEKWNFDFSAVRNKALDLAGSQWALTIDCGEFLDPNHRHDLLRDVIRKRPGMVGFVLRARIQGKDGMWEDKPSTRLFLNKPNHRYWNFIHNQLRLVGVGEETNITIVHPYHEADDEDRMERNKGFQKKLIKHLEEHPGDVMNMSNLIKTYIADEDEDNILRYGVQFVSKIPAGSYPIIEKLVNGLMEKRHEENVEAGMIDE